MKGYLYGLLVVAMATSGCARTFSTVTVGPNHTYVAATPGSGLPAQVEKPLLEACVAQASIAQKKQWGGDFNLLRFDRDGLEAEKVRARVGKHAATTALRGRGAWWGTNDEGSAEYRAVDFTCLLGPKGTVFTQVSAR